MRRKEMSISWIFRKISFLGRTYIKKEKNIALSTLDLIYNFET
jgi:hypothetical protein